MSMSSDRRAVKKKKREKPHAGSQKIDYAVRDRFSGTEPEPLGLSSFMFQVRRYQEMGRGTRDDTRFIRHTGLPWDVLYALRVVGIGKTRWF